MKGLIFFILILTAPICWSQPVDVMTPVNYQSPSARNLIAHWQVLSTHMGGVRWVDFVGKKLATLTSMSVTRSATSGWNVTSRRNGFGELNFDGTNDLVDLGTSTFFDFANTTTVISFNYKSSTCASACYIIAKRLAGGSGGWMGRLDSAGTFTFRVLDIDNNAAAGRTTTSTTLLDGKWHNLLFIITTDTVTAANNNVVIYYDGQLNQGALNSAANKVYTTATYPVYLGSLSDAGGGSFFTGALDDVRFYRGSMTAQQVLRVASSSLINRLQFSTYRQPAKKRSQATFYKGLPDEQDRQKLDPPQPFMCGMVGFVPIFCPR